MFAAIRKPKRSSLSAEFFRPYTEQMKRLLPEGAGFALLSAAGEIYCSSLEPPLPADERLLDRLRAGAAPLQLDSPEPGVLLAALPVLRRGELVAGVLRFEQRVAEPAGVALDRGLAAPAAHSRPAGPRVGMGRHPIAPVALAPMDELEWLFALMTELQDSSGESLAFEQLLASAMEPMCASFAGLAIPDRQLDFTCASRTLERHDAARAYQASRSHLLCYVQRRAAAFVANRAPIAESHVPPCKILAVPIARPGGGPAARLLSAHLTSRLRSPAAVTGAAHRAAGRGAARQPVRRRDRAAARAVLEREAAKLIELYGADEPMRWYTSMSTTCISSMRCSVSTPAMRRFPVSQACCTRPAFRTMRSPRASRAIASSRFCRCVTRSRPRSGASRCSGRRPAGFGSAPRGNP